MPRCLTQNSVQPPGGYPSAAGTALGWASRHKVNGPAQPRGPSDNHPWTMSSQLLADATLMIGPLPVMNCPARRPAGLLYLYLRQQEWRLPSEVSR